MPKTFVDFARRVSRRTAARLCVCLAAALAAATCEAVLEVEWIDADTIRVWGYGYTGGEGGTNIYDNPLGCCTNCTAITPAELNEIASGIKSLCSILESDATSLSSSIRYVMDLIYEQQDDISHFQTFSALIPLTNYVYQLDSDNTQKSLDRSYISSYGNNFAGLNQHRYISYNNGIYDYAQVVDNNLDTYIGDLSALEDSAMELAGRARQISYDIEAIENLPVCEGGNCDADGDGDNDGMTSDQMNALLDYLKHIDEDQHKRFDQLKVISNTVVRVDERFESYSEFLKHTLQQGNGTIKLYGTDVSWTNVYFNSENIASLGFDYDRSNVLQRIELLLYGLAIGDSVSTNVDEISEGDVERSKSSLESDIDTALDTSYIHDKREELQTVTDSIRELSNQLVFWGDGGSLQSFALGKAKIGDTEEYIYVPNSFTTSTNQFRQLCRYGFQAIYALLCLFWIWFFYVRLFKYVIVAFKWFVELVNEGLAS